MLNKDYTQYLANDYLKLRSVYSQNLYENLKSLENFERSYGKKPVIQLEELRQIFQVEGKKTYEDFRYLNVKILKKSVAEITEVTDLNVSYSTIKKARKVIAIEFSIKRKDWNYTKKQMEGLPEWYQDTRQAEANDDLVAETLKLQEEFKKQQQGEN